MLEKDLLFEGLEYLKFLKNKRKKNVPKIMVQTNGTWAKSENIIDILESLDNLGVDILDFPSDDRYHKEAGWDISQYERQIKDALIELKEQNVKTKIYLHFWGKRVSSIHKRGRAINLLEAKEGCQWPLTREIMPKYIPEATYFIYPNGDLNICEYGDLPPLGSAIKSKISNLEKNIPLEIKELMWEGIEGVLKKRGLYKEEKLKEYRKFPCSYCKKLFKK